MTRSSSKPFATTCSSTGAVPPPPPELCHLIFDSIREGVFTVAPDFRITTTDGKVVSLSDYKGQPVWLVFGASWCADCRAEAADLQATYQTFKDKGLQVLQVSIEEDTQAVKDYAGRVGLTFPMAADPQTIVAGQYRILGIPTHYFIDRDGIIRQMRIGGMPAADMTAAAGSIVE